MTRPDAGGGLFGSLRRLSDTAVSIVAVRLELLSTELEQEKLRLFDALLWAASALLVMALALALAIAFAVMLLWDGHRLAAVGVLALLFGAVAAVLMLAARARLRAPEGGAFALSLDELRKDRERLGTPSQ